MGQATHKLQHAGVFIRTSLSAPELFALVEQVAADTRGVGRYRNSPIRISLTGSSDLHRSFAVVTSKQKTRLRFEAIGDQPGGEERSRLGTRITMFQTRQQKFMGLVPSGPKELLHYHFYEQYMRNLQEAVWAEDPDAEVEIRERG